MREQKIKARLDKSGAKNFARKILLHVNLRRISLTGMFPCMAENVTYAFALLRRAMKIILPFYLVPSKSGLKRMNVE
jgi:hypothetical protein